MAEPPVANASPLIFLARSGHFNLLRLAGSEVLVPEAVAGEIRRRGPDDITVRALETSPWVRVVAAPEVPAAILSWDLGPGESAVLAWARAHPGTEVIVDDLTGRSCAASLGIPVRGTLGLVIVARKRGHLPAARPVLEELRRTGMYLSPQVMDRALTMVDE